MSYSISGIDVSKHQGSVDFKQVRDSGQRFAIVKATEGRSYTDPRFLENWQKLLELDGTFYRGAYHFARPDSVGGAADGKAEALDFCSALKAGGGYLTGCLPPALDFEKYSDFDGKDNVPWVDAFVKTVEDELGRSPMIYTGKNIWRYEVSNSDAFKHIPLWLVAYSRSGIDGEGYPSSAMGSLPWDSFALWQWSGGGNYAYGPKVPGINGGTRTVDLNWWHGTEEELAAFAMVDDKPDQPQCDPDKQALLAMLASAEDDLELGLTKVRSIRWALEALETNA